MTNRQQKKKILDLGVGTVLALHSGDRETTGHVRCSPMTPYRYHTDPRRDLLSVLSLVDTILDADSPVHPYLVRSLRRPCDVQSRIKLKTHNRSRVYVYNLNARLYVLYVRPLWAVHVLLVGRAYPFGCGGGI